VEPAPSSEVRGAWLKPLGDWPLEAACILREGAPVVRIVVARVQGSAPREVGTCMLVDDRRTLGTIGGGQLEWVAISAAREMLADLRGAPAKISKLVLGTELAQCCGGVVELWIERFTPADYFAVNSLAEAVRRGRALLVSTLNKHGVERRIEHEPSGRPSRAELRFNQNGDAVLTERLDQAQREVWLFGAGHVGQALIRVLSQLPFQVRWIDSRAELLPGDVERSIHIEHSLEPVQMVSQAPAGASFIVMTHSHALDFELCCAVLERGDFAWAGVIGSKSKAARFRSRLAKRGIPAEQIARLTCPMGVAGVDSKLPAAIAVAVSAQLLQTPSPPSSTERTLYTVPAEVGCSQPSAQESCATCELRRETS
jgi:xanthine dehydrogenase accessory factor